MKISYNWLKDYLNIDVEPDELSVILTSIGLEVEGLEEWESVKGGMKGIVIGKVLTCERHPDADRLSITTVDVGTGEPLNVVCGAPNVAAGQVVAVATAGAMVFSGNEQFEIKRSKIRGQVSEGMICAEDELGLGKDHEGIMVLDPAAVTGSSAADYFGIVRDHIFEIGLTPNRIDCSSHYGVARDLAAYFNLQHPIKARLPEVNGFKPGKKEGAVSVDVEDREACIRYSGLTIRNLKVKPSPAWLQNRLKSIGLNPVNNVVDITNYVLHETGQPLHAFDAEAVTGNSVVVRTLPEKTRFVTLDGLDRELASSDLMICNASEGMCIAGVFGGLHSGVRESTTAVFLESATFSPVSVRRTSRRHDIHTDASYRFERGTDPEITIYALKRAALLITEIAGGEIIGDIVDIYPAPVHKAVVRLSLERMKRLIGKEIPLEIVKTILYSLDIRITGEEEGILTLEIPQYRVDVTREADVIEEVLRIYGYNNVETGGETRSIISYTDRPDKEKTASAMAELLSGNGFAEIMCNSLTPATWFETTGDFAAESVVRLANPLSSDLNVMRISLLPGMLNTVAWNINRQNTDLKLYELGYIYSLKKPERETLEITDNYSERLILSIAITGKIAKNRWNAPETATGFFHVKGYTEMVLDRFGIRTEGLTISSDNSGWFSEGLSYASGGEVIASLGIISRKYLNMFDIRQELFYAEIKWDVLLRKIREVRAGFNELPRYPWVRRDLALLVDSSVKYSMISEIAFKTERHILKSVDMFDVYESDSLGKGKKSYAISFILRDDRATLTEKNIEKTMNSIAKAFERELGASLR